MKQTRYENTATFVFVYSPAARPNDSTSVNHFEKVVSYTQDELITPLKRSRLKSADIVLACEDRRQFEELAEKFQTELNPSGPHEEFLVKQMLCAQWRLQRLDRIEDAMRGALEGTGEAFPDKTKITGFTRIEQYRKMLERSYKRSASALRASQKRQQ